MNEIDELDKAIVRLLQEDGRISNREIGRKLQVSEGTVRVRLRRMESHGQFKLVTLRDPAAFGLNCMAFVRFSVEPSRVGELASLIFEMKEFFFVSIALSEYNIYSVAVTRDKEALDKIIRTKLLSKKGFLAYEILEEMESTKFDYHYTV